MMGPPRSVNGVPLPTALGSTVPELTNPVALLDVPQGWGLGFHVYEVDLPGMRSAGSGDWSGLFNTFYWIDRTAGIAAVIGTQLLPFFDGKALEAFAGFERGVYAGLDAGSGQRRAGARDIALVAAKELSDRGDRSGALGRHNGQQL